MKQPWYEEIFKIIDQVMLLKIPFEIIHFPDTGIHSSIGKYAELSQLDKDFGVKSFFIDLRAARFNEDIQYNKQELYRILKTHIEHYLDEPFPEGRELNFYRNIEKITLKYRQQRKKVLFAFQNSAQIILDRVPDFRDFIIFLDHLRDITRGDINYLISTTVPLFNDNNPSPVPLIVKYFDYYRPGWLYRSVNEDVLGEAPYKKHSSEDVLKLLEISGGLVAVIKSCMRDFTLLDKKLNEIYTLKINKEFFEEHQNCKMRLARICEQLSDEAIEGLKRIIDGEKAATLDPQVYEFLKKTSILDDKDNIRGQILPGYIEFCYTKQHTVKSQELPVEQNNDYKVKGESTNNNVVFINQRTSLNSSTGEIFVNNIPQNYYLTEKELKIINALLSKENGQITREELAKVIWSENSGLKYSDWAIDKLVSRLREKLGDKKPYKVIKTARNKGFELITN